MRKYVLPLTIMILSLVSLTLISVKLSLQQAPYTVEIRKVILRKEDGTPSTVFKRGEFVFVEVQIVSIAPYVYAIQPILTIVRASYAMELWGLGAFKYNLTAGASITAMPAFKIPENAPIGEYDLAVFVWSDWAIYGGYPLAAPYTTKFEVRE